MSKKTEKLDKIVEDLLRGCRETIRSIDKLSDPSPVVMELRDGLVKVVRDYEDATAKKKRKEKNASQSKDSSNA